MGNKSFRRGWTFEGQFREAFVWGKERARLKRCKCRICVWHYKTTLHSASLWKIPGLSFFLKDHTVFTDPCCAWGEMLPSSFVYSPYSCLQLKSYVSASGFLIKYSGTSNAYLSMSLKWTIDLAVFLQSLYGAFETWVSFIFLEKVVIKSCQPNALRQLLSLASTILKLNQKWRISGEMKGWAFKEGREVLLLISVKYVFMFVIFFRTIVSIYWKIEKETWETQIICFRKHNVDTLRNLGCSMIILYYL